MKNLTWLAPLAASALLLTACERVEDDDQDTVATAGSNETLTASLTGADDLSTVAGAIGDAELGSVFDGASAYTVLAPTDDAFEALGDGASQLTPDGDTAPMVALLRNHIVTGHLRPEDLRSALEEAADGTVEMASVGSDSVTFAMDGDNIVARGADGTEARLLVDRAIEASNGVVIPIDGILRKLPAATTARR